MPRCTERNVPEPLGKRRVNVRLRINQQIIAIATDGDIPRLFEFLDSYLPLMNLVNFATTWHRLAKCAATQPREALLWRRHPVVLKLVASTIDALQKTAYKDTAPSPQALSNIAWSLATLEIVDPMLLQLLSNLARQDLSNFKPFEIAMLLWAFAKSAVIDPSVRPQSLVIVCIVAGCVTAHVNKFPFRSLAMSAWSFAAVRYYDAELFTCLAEHLVLGVRGATCEELLQTGWAFGSARVHHARLWTALSQRVVALKLDLKRDEWMHISNLMWAYARQSQELQDTRNLQPLAAPGLPGLDSAPPGVHLPSSMLPPGLHAAQSVAHRRPTVHAGYGNHPPPMPPGLGAYANPPSLDGYPAQSSAAAWLAAADNECERQNACEDIAGHSTDYVSEEDLEASVGEEDELPQNRTTVMLKGIPTSFSRDLLVRLLVDHGFEGFYDLVYVPVDFSCGESKGYAFVNMTSEWQAERMFLHFDSFADWPIPYDGVCTMCWSSVLQGRDAFVAQYVNSPLMHSSVPDACKPGLYDVSGAQILFPLPTKAVIQPRLKGLNESTPILS